MAFVKTNWLDAATSPQVTDPEEVAGVAHYGLQVSTTGGPTGAGVQLEGSIDGSNWVALVSESDGVTWSSAGQYVRPVKYLRLNLIALQGGTAPTLSASVIAI